VSVVRARSLLALRRYDEALAELAGVTPEAANHQVHCLRAQAFLGLRRWPEAKRAAGDAQAEAPENEWGYRLGAIAAMSSGQLRQARSLAQRAVHLAPSTPEAHQVAAVTAMRLKDRRLAFSHAQTLLELAPDTAMAHRTYARALMTSSRVAEAEAPLRRALELDPHDDEAMSLLADVVGTHNKKQARALRLDALRTDPHDRQNRTRALRHGGVHTSMGEHLLVVGRRVFVLFVIGASNGSIWVLPVGYLCLFGFHVLLRRIRARHLPPLVWEGLRDVRRNADLLWLVIPSACAAVVSSISTLAESFAGRSPRSALIALPGILGLVLAWRLRAGDLKQERLRDFLWRQRLRRFVFRFPRLR
jgi:tetratricopeptide (TPR) repeat protein